MSEPNADPAIEGPTHVTLLVEDQDEALAWYTETLGFETRADEPMEGDDRWLTVSPTRDSAVEIVLMPPGDLAEDERAAALEAQIGAQPVWVFSTDDCRAAHEVLSARGVSFTSPPEEVPWGVSALFEDLYGNVFNLVEAGEGDR